MKHRGRSLLILAAVLAFIGVAGFFHARWLPWAGLWLDVGQRPREADYVFILGGGAEVRPFVAAAIVRAGFAKTALVSHVKPSAEDGDDLLFVEHEVTSAVLRKRGLRPEQIVVLGHDHLTTYDEACSLGDFLREHPKAKVLVVTNDYHTRRARWIFARVLGPRMADVTFVAAPTEAFDLRWWWRNDKGFTMILAENLKFFFYWFRYSPWPWVVMAVIVLAWVSSRVNRAINRRLPAPDVAQEPASSA
jgi:uncharacterized SAM-binding protein YcdF (DUF218 family)